MTNANDTEVAGLVDVVFVGGPLHGHRVQMANPEFHITLEPTHGEEVVYCRRMVVDAARGNAATAPPRTN